MDPRAVGYAAAGAPSRSGSLHRRPVRPCLAGRLGRCGLLRPEGADGQCTASRPHSRSRRPGHCYAAEAAACSSQSAAQARSSWSSCRLTNATRCSRTNMIGGSSSSTSTTRTPIASMSWNTKTPRLVVDRQIVTPVTHTGKPLPGRQMSRLAHPETFHSACRVERSPMRGTSPTAPSGPRRRASRLGTPLGTPRSCAPGIFAGQGVGQVGLEPTTDGL